MRLMISAGASGGGVYPALAVLQALDNKIDDVLWVGGKDGMEADLVARAAIPFKAVSGAAVHGVGLRAIAGISRLARGYFAARPILRQFKPDVLFFTGGFVSIPVGLAGRKVKTLLYVPDIEPGLALRTISRFADHIALTTEEGRKFFPRRIPATVTGYPTRANLTSWKKKDAYESFDLSPKLPILLVFGGSKGAQSINRAVIAILPQLLKEMQIIHISGQETWKEVETAKFELSPEPSSRYRAYPYLHDEMGAAMTIADLVVSRAGASSLGEFPQFGLPAVVVPYPHAWRYQAVNADYLAKRGGAVMLPDDKLSAKLLPMIQSLIRDKDERSKMRKHMRALAKPKAASLIGDLLLDLAGKRGREI